MIKILKNLNKVEVYLILLCVLLVSSSVWLDLKMPEYMSTITRLVETEGSLMKDIILNGLYMLLCALGSLAITILVGFIVANISSSFSRNLRKNVFNKVLDLSTNEIKSFSTSSLLVRTINDITYMEAFLGMGIQLLIKAPITAVWAISKILNKSWQWSAVTGVAVIILVSLIIVLMTIVIPRFKLVQKLLDKVNGVTRENLNGIRVIRAFNAEEYQEDKFAKVNDNLTHQHLFNQKTFAILSPIMYFVMNTLALSIYFIGAKLIANAMFTDKISLFGDMIVFSSYSMQIIMSFLMLAMIFMMIPRSEVSANRINEVLDGESSIKNGSITKNKNNLKGTIEFKNVSFKYPDAEEYLLKNISFKVEKGETVAFIGSTGSGKSTLVNLIPRFYDTTEGEVLINGINVKDYDLNYLYSLLGYVPQSAVIFNGSVKYNTGYGDKKISEEKIKKALEVAKAKEFVEKMDNKYDTVISSGGTNISGGQKQRLSIARAIARNPEIYIFDDSFSALDYKTDYDLRKELKKYTKDSTNVIVATRIGTIMHADKIIVLDKGECVGIGRHEDLLKNCKVYKEIAYSQLGKEELTNE